MAITRPIDLPSDIAANPDRGVGAIAIDPERACRRIWFIGLAACLLTVVTALSFVERLRQNEMVLIGRDMASILRVGKEDIASIDSSRENIIDSTSAEKIYHRLERLTQKCVIIFNSSGQPVHLDQDDAANFPTLFAHWPQIRGAADSKLIDMSMSDGAVSLFGAKTEIPVADGKAVTLVVYAPTDQLFSQFYDERRLVLFMAGLLILSALVLSWLIARNQRRQLAYTNAIVEREHRLRTQQAHLIEAQRLAKLGSWEMTLDPPSMVASEQYLAIYQMTVENCPATDEEWIERFVRDPLSKEEAFLNASRAEKGLPTEGIRKVVLDDGTEKWIQFKTLPSHDISGRLIGKRGFARDITEERSAMERAQDYTAELEKARRLAGYGSWVWDITSDSLTTSPEMMAIYGTDESNHPRTFHEWSERFVHPEDAATYWPMYRSKFYGKAWDRERRLIDANGVEKWIRTIAEPVFASTGELTQYRGVTSDVTAQKRVLLELEERSKQLLETQRIARMASWHWDFASDRLETSDNYAQLYGLDPIRQPKTMSNWIMNFCHPDERELALENAALLRSGGSIDMHRKILTVDNEVKWLHVIASAVRANDGTVIGCSGISRDITAEKQKALELVESERQLSEAQRIARMGHFFWDLKTDIIDFHANAGNVFGPSPGKYFHTFKEWQEKFCHPDDLPISISNLKTNIRDGKPFSVQRKVLTPAGATYWVEISAEPENDVGGKAISYRGIFRDITPMKLAEQQLVESEKKFRLISEHMHDQVALHSADGTILYCSPSTKSVMGYDPEQVTGSAPYQNIHNKDVARVRAVISAFANDPTSQSTTCEYRFRHRGGHFIWLETVIVAVRGDDGRVKHYQASSRDVTRRHNIEGALRASEARFRLLTEISSDWYWETDEEHRVSFISQGFPTALAADRNSVIGHKRWERFAHLLNPEEWQMHRRQLANKQSFHALILIAKNPTTGEANGFYSISGRPVFDVDGEFKGYQGIGRDITRIKLSEQQLARSEERYRLIAENMQDLITLHAANGKLLFVSPSLTSITGLIDDDIIGQSPRKLLHPDDSLWVRRRFALFAARKEAPQRLTYRLRHHDGHYLWLESHISLVFDSHSRLQHIQIASRDVTARREAEIAVTRKTAELAKANKQLAIEIRERQELERNILLTIEMELSKVGLELHDDLGQNLTGIALLSKSLENRLTEKQSESAVDAARISDLVNRTIRHTRMISHGLSPYIWGVDGLSAALSQLTNDINSLGVVACRTHFGTHIDIQDEVVARSLYRIAQEAINNALKHSHAQTITLSLTNERDDIELTIADNGIGGMDLDRGADLEAGNRFHSIRHRCSVIGATLTIKHPKRGGTTVCVNWRPAQTDNDRKLEMEVNQSGMLQ